MKPAFGKVLLLWLLAILASVAVLASSRFVADMSFFLPSSPTAQQRVLVGQMQEGAVSRLLMLAIEGGDQNQRAQASMRLREELLASHLFLSVQNGEAHALAAERDVLLRWRYHLSPGVSAERFSQEGLREAILRSIDLAASPVGYLFKPYLLQDPTGELLEILSGLHPDNEPDVRGGVWSSPDGQRALLLLQTRAAGADTDGQEAAIRAAESVFASLVQTEGLQPLRLSLSGPGLFAVQSRDAIRSEVSRVSLLSMLGIVLVLIWVYRSPRTLALGLLPVITGALVGAAVVSLVHGQVHGITIGFGAALIGEAVDYAIYFCVQSGRVGLQTWRQTFWPTIRLGVFTSVAGFGALLLAGFPGMAQLGLYALSGVITAALVTRHVLPVLAGDRLAVPAPGFLTRWTLKWLVHARILRWPLLALAVLALGYLLQHRTQLWSTNLSALSTVSAEAAAADARLRTDIGAPDARYLVLFTGTSREAALQGAERAGRQLDALVQQGLIGGYDSPARFMPSQQTQAARLQSLPSREKLEPVLAQALQDAPLSASRLRGFVDAVDAARQSPMLTRSDLDGTALALAVDSLLSPSGDAWNAVLPLRPVPGAADAQMPVAELQTALAGTGAVFLDLKTEFEQLYAQYLRQALWLSLGGVLGIALLLALTLRSAWRLARVLLSLAVVVVLVIAGLHLSGTSLHLLHLVGMLLIVAVGSNYALFFDRAGEQGSLSSDVWLSMAVAVATTAIGFGALASSGVPVLQAIGVTVAPGVLLALVVSAAVLGVRRESV